MLIRLRPWLLLLFPEQSPQGDTGNLDDLELDTGNITLGTTLPTETGNQDFIVGVNEVEAAVVGDESSNLLGILDQLNTDTLTNGRVGLLRFNTTTSREKNGIHVYR